MIAGVVLAAGRGERFGADKLLRELGGRPLVCRTVHNCLASRLDAVVAVVGPPGGPVEEALRMAFLHDSRLTFVSNPAPDRGQMSSVKTGLRGLPARTAAAMVFLADMPFVGADIADRLLEEHGRTGGFVVPECGGTWRHPRIIPAAHFADFLALADAESGGPVFERFRAEVSAVPAGQPWNFLDVDTAEDLARAESLLP